MLKKHRRILAGLFWLLALGWAYMLFFFSGQDGAQSGELSLQVTQMILRAFPSISLDLETLHFIVRKIAHFCIFALEGFLLSMAAMLSFPRRRRFFAAASVLVCAVMAVLNEYHQSFMEGRSCEVRDMFIDSAGALCGVLAASALLWIAGRLRRRN